MKQILIALVCFFIILFGFLLLDRKYFDQDDAKWTTYKKDKKTIDSYPSTREELERVGHSRTQKRAPASPTREPVLHERRLVKDSGTYNLDDPNFEYVNSAAEDWQKGLSERLLKFQDAGSRVMIKPVESLVMIKKSKARYVEKARIVYLHENGRQNSANVLVDSESGKIINVWNRTKHEDGRKREIALTPSLIIY